MLIANPNPTQVVLEAVAVGLDGAPKLDVTGGTVRVYHMVGLAETVDLSVTALAQVGVTNVWRYVWTAPALPVGAYTAEYKLTDANAVVGMVDEDLIARTGLTEAQVTQLLVDLELIRKVESNRWKLDKNTLQMIFYDDDQVTPLLKFNLFDRNGAPNVEEVFERVPTP